MMSKTKRIFYWGVLLFIVLLLGAGYYFSSEIVQFKKRTLDEDKTNLKIQSVADFGLPEPESIRFQNGDIRLKGWFFKHPKPKSCGIILLHGQTGSRWGALKYSPYFWKKGCHVFAFDARHHGESDGEYGTYGYYEKQDLERAHETFSEISGVPEEKIGILGESYGAATAIQYSSGRKDIAFVIADSCFSDLETIVRTRAIALYGKPILVLVPIALAFAELRANFDSRDVSPKQAARNIQVPFLLVHSKADTYTPYQHSEHIYSETRFAKRMLVLTEDGAGHGGSITTNRAGYEKSLNQFFLTFLTEI